MSGGESGFQKQARNIFKAGFSLLQQVSQQRVDSSDDESSEIVENEEYITKGQRGIVVFKTYSVKTDMHKILHLNLYKAQIVQYSGNKKRTYQCDEFTSITRNSDNNVLIEIRKPLTLQTHYKKIIFESDQLAHQFHQYIDFINESGRSTKTAFNQIDYRKTGIISCPDLRKALARVDLKASEQDIINMMAMGTGKDGVFDYSDFIGMFFNSFVSNLRQCLQEWLIQATATSTDDTTRLSKVDTSLDALPGEVIAFAPTERVYWCIFGGKHCKYPQHIPGVMYATNYRIVLFALRKASCEKASHSRFDVPSFFNMISIPLTSLHRIYFAAPRNSIYLVCKDHRTVRITLSGFENSKNKVETFVQVLQGMAFYNQHSLDPKTHLFAYKNLTYFSNNEQGWNLCDLIKEYVRQGLFDSPDWKVLENKEYSLADTYPRYLVLPQLMSKDEIRVAAGFRSKARLPVVTYLHLPTGAVLTRSAQPMVGLGQKNCPADEKLLNLYRCKGKQLEPRCEEDLFTKFCILDARGKVAATLNMAVGKGTEDVSQYQNAELVFCNIDNIHVMRTSAGAMADALSSSTAQALGGKDRESQLLMEGSQAGYYSRIEDAGWLRHCRLILLAGTIGAEKLHFEGTSVLVHCSDGWDRTAQICGVTQILLDPYFRTIEGFATLIEKEWCAFGHKFQDRCGHGQDANNLPDERSPVFLQFLDVLYQLLVQFPTAFEFTENLLLFLADHLNSCLFGNFLGNSEKERIEDLDVRTLTKSVWSYVFGRRHLFANRHYTAFDKPIWPSCGAAAVQVWSRFWLRWDVAAHPNNISDTPWHDDWGNGAETDPNLVVKRSSYSYVSKSASPVNIGAAPGNGKRPSRPLAVRGIEPTHAQGSDSSLHSLSTNNTGTGGAPGSTGAADGADGATDGDSSPRPRPVPGSEPELNSPSATDLAGLDASLLAPHAATHSAAAAADDDAEMVVTRETEADTAHAPSAPIIESFTPVSRDPTSSAAVTEESTAIEDFFTATSVAAATADLLQSNDQASRGANTAVEGLGPRRIDVDSPARDNHEQHGFVQPLDDDLFEEAEPVDLSGHHMEQSHHRAHHAFELHDDSELSTQAGPTEATEHQGESSHRLIDDTSGGNTVPTGPVSMDDDHWGEATPSLQGKAYHEQEHAHTDLELEEQSEHSNDDNGDSDEIHEHALPITSAAADLSLQNTNTTSDHSTNENNDEEKEDNESEGEVEGEEVHVHNEFADTSQGEDEEEDEDFQVMSDPGASTGTHSPNHHHRHYRIKRSIDPSTMTLAFNEMYDDAGTPTPDWSERRSLASDSELDGTDPSAAELTTTTTSSCVVEGSQVHVVPAGQNDAAFSFSKNEAFI